MRRPSCTSSSSINFSSITQKISVDNRISLRNYYRIADNLLKQANIYREEKNLIDLYIILLRYSSLVSETIPDHQDYQALHPKERVFFRKKLSGVIDELETLKPKVRRKLDELERVKKAPTKTHQSDGTVYSSRASSSFNNKQMVPAITSSSFLKQNNGPTRVSSLNSVDLQFQKLSLGLPLPKQETLSRHSLLGPNGLRAQWLGPSAEFKVNYPTNSVMDLSEIASLDQVGKSDSTTKTENNLNLEKSSMDSVLSLDDGRWLAEESGLSSLNGTEKKDIEWGNIVQLSPPPVMAQTHPIPPHLVADPRPGPPKELQNGHPSTSSYQDLHIPVKMLEDFLRLAQANTAKNLETCGVLAGSLRNRVFYITTLIVPKQESTSDTCQTLNEEELFEIQDSRSLFQLGWIHTHPTQTCFMSSVDLHTHYSYQVMLPEAIAIVMAPTDTSCPHGIFHLSDPGGVSVMRNCEQRGFHPHEEPEDGSPLYEHCSHVYMNANLKFDVIDLRCA